MTVIPHILCVMNFDEYIYTQVLSASVKIEFPPAGFQSGLPNPSTEPTMVSFTTEGASLSLNSMYIQLQSIYSFESVLFSFKIMFMWFTHFAACISSSVIFIAQLCSTLWLCHNLSISQLMNIWDAFSFYLLQKRCLWAFYTSLFQIFIYF